MLANGGNCSHNKKVPGFSVSVTGDLSRVNPNTCPMPATVIRLNVYEKCMDEFTAVECKQLKRDMFEQLLF